MKRLITLLLLSLMIGTAGFAQSCGTTVTGITPGTGSTPGIAPPSDALHCHIPGQVYYDTLYFTNYTNFSGFAVTNLTIDSIENLPSGMCWSTNKANNSFAGGENGIIRIYGSTNAAPGQYKLRILAHATAGAITLPPNTDMETLLGLRYYLKVTCANGGCPQIDTTLGKTHSFIAYTSSCSLGLASSITTNGPTSFCQGGSVTLSGPIDSSYTYLWSTGATTSSITVQSSGSYSLTVHSPTDSSTAPPVPVYVNICTQPGFTPPSSQIPCITAGQYVSDTLLFINYTTISGQTVNSLTFDSISDLPAGLHWLTSAPGNYLSGGDSCLILIYGTTSAPAGQYKLRIKVDMNISNGLSQTNANLETLSGDRYYLRVACSNGGCIAVDTNLGATNSYIAYTSGCTTAAIATITTNGSTTICQGSSVTLFAPVSAGYTYLWSSGSTYSQITVSTAGSYSVTVYSAADTAVSTPVTVTSVVCATPGFSPASELMPCIQNNNAVLDTIYFTNYSTVSGLQMDSLTFDSIGNLPQGLTWSTSNLNNTFGAGQSGYILISGTPTTAIPGQYKLKILGHAALSVITLPPYTDMESILGVRYYLRVACSNGGCSLVDTVNGRTNAFIADSSCGSAVISAIITPSGSTLLCSGQSLALIANGGAGFSYLWSTGATTQSIVVNTAGTYTLTLGYNGNTSTTSILVTVNPTPTAYFTIQPDTATAHLWYIDNQCTGQGLSYSWTWGDSSVNGSGATPSHTYNTAGYYDVCVSVTTDSGCVANYCDSNVYLFKTENQMIQLIVRQNTTGIATTTEDAQNIRYYAGAVHFATAITIPTDIKLYDLSGRLVMSYGKFTGSVLDIQASEFAGGVYIIHLQNDNKSLSKKLTILQ